MNLKNAILLLSLFVLIIALFIPVHAEVLVIKDNKIVFPENDPSADPLYYSMPPLHYDSALTTLVLFRSTAESLRRIVPEPLEINTDNLAWAYMFDDTLTNSYRYLEGGISIPVTFTDKKETREGIYVAYMYLDTPNVQAIAAGREIWGYPKKDAEISYDYSSPLITASMERNGDVIMNLSVDLTQNPVEQMGSLVQDAFNLKYIPSIVQGAPPEVLQLTSSPVFDPEAPPFPLFPATLELFNSSEDHLADIVVDEVIGGIFIPTESMVLVHGEILFNYLTEKIPKEGYWLGPTERIYRWNK